MDIKRYNNDDEDLILKDKAHIYILFKFLCFFASIICQKADN